MTPLLGTKTPSAPVGDKSGGDTRAARSLLSCALWRGIGRLWRGMGGMGCPEPLSAHRPHQQQGLSGFHETRDTAFFRITAVRFSVGVRGVASPETAVRATVPAGKSLFPVHHCSLLFAMVHQKILSCASALVPPGRCFPVRCGAAWGGYGAAWAAAVARTGNTAFPVRRPSDISSGANWPAFLTTRRGEVRERAVRTRREPLGARRRT